MKGYKGFKKGMICDPTGRNPKQYAENTVFEEDKASICSSGMHFCVDPFDVLDYYRLVNEVGAFNDFAQVEALDEVKTDDNKKYCTTKLRIGAKLDFSGFIKACVDFVIEKTKCEVDDSAQIGSSGYSAKIGSSGDYAKIGSSGDCAQIGSSGDCAKIGSSGNSAKIGSSGDSAQIGSSGDCARVNSEGEDSVICCAGHGSIVKARKGSWITLSEWKYDKEKERHVPVCVKTEFVDGERIKENTRYCLVCGEFKEVE